MNWEAKWIKPKEDMGEVVPVFYYNFSTTKKIRNATLAMTAMGVYEAMLNGERVSDYVLAPGWTDYYHRLQYQSYDVTKQLKKENNLEILVGKGWYRGRIGWFEAAPDSYQGKLRQCPCGLLAQLEIVYADGSREVIVTDDNWRVKESQIRFSEIYDGEHYDASFISEETEGVVCFDGPWDTLISQEGEKIKEQERMHTSTLFVTPKGETVIDFGQEVTGYIEVTVDAKAGEEVRLSFAEVLDKDGNFYTENYRTAKCDYHYICCDGKQTYHSHLTFYGFRYVRVDAFPGGVSAVKPENFTAIVVHSELKRTGYLSCSEPLLNKLFDNVIWGQKGNFLDVPTDCPQRDERCGWTGDAQVFVKTAALNYDVEKFFAKWLGDMASGQREDGRVGHVVPDILQSDKDSAAWGDAATICPWELYLAYGNCENLAKQYDCMKNWVKYITNATEDAYLWTGGWHYGDWLALDAPYGSYTGSTRFEFISSAFYAYSTELVIKAGNALDEDVTYYEELHQKIVNKFRETYPEYTTQTECVLALQFGLAEDKTVTAKQLVDMIISCGRHLETGFVGTPYLLHVLSDNGYTELAYDLLLRKEYPSWLYPVTKGATTIWEHWDGIREDGEFWNTDMNSYNHYAYGSVTDWVYTKAAGIQTVEEYPGYERVYFAPQPDERLEWLKASVETRRGLVSSSWKKQDGIWRYDIVTPVPSTIVIENKTYEVTAGRYCFYGHCSR